MWVFVVLTLIMFGYIGGNGDHGFLYLIAPDDPVTFIVELILLFYIAMIVAGIKRGGK